MRNADGLEISQRTECSRKMSRVFERLVIGNKEEGFGGKINNMALTAKSVDFGIIVNVESAQKIERE